MTHKFMAARCPLCQQELIFDTTLPNYGSQHVLDVGLAHYRTHSVGDWAREVQALQNQLADREELRSIPYWAMPRA